MLYRLFDHRAQAAVTSGKHGFQRAQLHTVVIVLDGLGIEMILQQLTSSQILLRGDLLFPLEGRVGLGHKIGRGHMDPKAPLFVDAIFLPGLNDFIYQLRNAQHIFVGLRGKSQHEIKLDVAPAARKGPGAGGEDFLLLQILVDHIPKALGACLRCKGQTAFADGLKLFHQLPGEIIRPQGGHGKADAVPGAVRNQLVRQFLQAPVIGGGKAGKGNFIVAGIVHNLHRLAVEHLRTLLAHRAAAEACLAEPAAPDAAPENLQIGPVVDDFRGGNDHSGGEIGGIQILDDSLGDHRRCALTDLHGGKGAVRVILRGIEARHIDAIDLGHLPEEFLLAPSGILRFLIKGNDFHSDVFSLADGEKVDEIRQGLRVEGTNATGKNHVFQTVTIFGMQGDTSQIQHIENIGIGHLIADGEGDHVKIRHRVLAFQSPQGQMVFAHLLLHIPPRGKHPLAPHPVHSVHHTVENPHSHIGHADLIGIREAERHPDVHILFVLLHRAPFAAGISGRLLNGGQDSVFQVGHRYTS